MKAMILLLLCGLATACSSPSTDGGTNATENTGESSGVTTADDDGAAQHLPKVPLVIHHGEGAPDTRLMVEIALTPKEQEKGLMHRSDIGARGGMLFPMVPPRMSSFWMKDMLVSLDFVFIRNDGSVARIVRHAEPGDRTPIFAEGPVLGVLELRAGEAGALALSDDDKISWGECTSAARSTPIVQADDFCPA